MKDISGYLLIAAIVIGCIITTVSVNAHIKNNGQKVETVFNTPLKEIFKPNKK